MWKMISSYNDLVTEVNTGLGHDGTPAIADAVASTIAEMEDHPPYGENWSEFLEGLDYWAIYQSIGA